MATLAAGERGPGPLGSSAAGVSRRHLLALAGWGTLVAIALQAVVVSLAFFWPRRTGTFGSKVSAGSPADFQVDDVKYFVEGKFYLSRVEEGFIALYQKCPHLGCTVPWRPDFQWPYQGQTITGLFRCPCHGSTYLRNGQIIFGPAPRPMDYMPITLQGDTLVVDTGVIKQRERWEPSQAFNT
jgi:cytochrome b6-f complex iron-sulfur subunit